MNEREKPIIFSGPMVRAILDGRKTQTRRIVKNPDYFSCLTGDCPHWDKKQCAESMAEASAYGPTGRQLWVREAFALPVEFDYLSPAQSPRDLRFYRECTERQRGINPRIGKWRSPLHMPRWHSRIDLEITAIRVERLQDISEKDAEAEGAKIGDVVLRDKHRRPIGTAATTVVAYRHLWESINGPESWDANPFVWVIEFKVIK